MLKTKTVKAPTPKERRALRIMIVLGMVSLLNFFYWFFSPVFIGDSFLYSLLLIVLTYTSLRLMYEWYHYWNISVPAQKEGHRQFTVDFLTTYFPGEPYDMIENTLLAIKEVRYPHTTILCDEADDERLKAFCRIHGIKHISRTNRIDAKAGNINNALNHIATGEICVILDPDHVPQPDFLDDIIPHFEDPEIGYVQIVQAYKNFDESYVAKGAAQQTYQFYGPMMMCMNSYGTVNAIGANCTFRRAALDSIGGHAPGLAEDMHTSMLLHAKGWKSVYVPKVLARGLVPSSLTAYYKQQLKWSRGTLELLVSVYPKIFKTLTNRQRLHYLTIPLHYIVGFVYLLNFLIPIISLCTATSPWKGNLIFFGLITFPLITCLLTIRSFVQRWVMEESERGFHMVGGLLLISTWWVFCLGTIYTLLRKKVPYLPTPKTGEDRTSWKLMIPNVLVAIASLLAIIYGLKKDYTPFSIFMSGFAALNMGFMSFSFYLATHKYPVINAIKHKTKRNYYQGKLWVKQKLWNFRHALYRNIRQVALPLVVLSIITSLSLIFYDQYMKWEGVRSYPELPVVPHMLLGIYAPGNYNGLSDLHKTAQTESELSTRFDLVSHYIPWGNTGQNTFHQILDTDQKSKHIPFISWEPWGSTFDFSNQYKDLAEEKQIFTYITKGFFDDYLKQVAEEIKRYDGYVYLRFAHEFDNPQYPWSIKGENTPEQFKQAWTYIHNYFNSRGVSNVKWVWSPWKPQAIARYYPGDELVDAIGITALHYGNINEQGASYSFDDLYLPLKDSLRAAQIDKPVILAEFGSLDLENGQNTWITDALDSIYKNHNEIAGIIFFNSDIDKNIPVSNTSFTMLDWTLKETKEIRYKLWELEQEMPSDTLLNIEALNQLEGLSSQSRLPLPDNVKGIGYKKGQNWFKNYQVMNIRTADQDFSQIKDLGLNTIKYFGSPVYNYNMLQAAATHQLDVVYGLWLPSSLGHSHSDTKDMEEDILNLVSELRAEERIVAWNLGNDIISKISQFNKPEKSRVKIVEHLFWLNKLVNKIKSIDPDRPILVDLDLNRLSLTNATLLLENLPAIDGLSLTLTDNQLYQEFHQYAARYSIPYIIGDIRPEVLNTLPNIPGNFMLRNWQDQHESNLVSFDGILDHKGRVKQNLLLTKTLLNRAQPLQAMKEKIRVLRPALRLRPGKEYEYHALINREADNAWAYGMPSEKEKLEWNLIKCDRFGTPLAFKTLGTGISKTIRIPETYDHYYLVLKYNANGVVYSTRTSLNIPSGNAEPDLVAQYGF